MVCAWTSDSMDCLWLKQSDKLSSDFSCAMDILSPCHTTNSFLLIDISQLLSVCNSFISIMNCVGDQMLSVTPKTACVYFLITKSNCDDLISRIQEIKKELMDFEVNCPSSRPWLPFKRICQATFTYRSCIPSRLKN